MVVESSRTNIRCDDGTIKIQLDSYITSSDDLDEITGCAPSSRALNVLNGDIWLLMDDMLWHRYKSTETREAVV